MKNETITREVTDSKSRTVSIAYDSRMRVVAFCVRGVWSAYWRVGGDLVTLPVTPAELVDLLCWTVKHADLITEQEPDRDGVYPATIIAIVDAAMMHGYGMHATDNAESMATRFFEIHHEFTQAVTDNVPGWAIGWATAVMLDRAKRSITVDDVWRGLTIPLDGTRRSVTSPVRAAILQAYADKVNRASLDAEDAARDSTYV